MSVTSIPTNPILSRRQSYTIITIYVFQVIFATITLVTLIIPVEEDPTIWHFPYMVYLPNTLSILALLYATQQILKKRFGIIDKYSDNEGVNDLISMFDWKDDYSILSLIIRRVSLLLGLVVTLLVWLLGIGAIEFLFSPMNFITLSFGLSMFCIWLAFGVKETNSKAILYILTILFIDMVLHTSAAIIAGDELVLPLTLSYQLLSILLISIRWLYVKNR